MRFDISKEIYTFALMTEVFDDIFNEVAEEAAHATVEVEEQYDEIMPYCIMYDIRTNVNFSMQTTAYNEFIKSTKRRMLMHMIEKACDAFFPGHKPAEIEPIADSKWNVCIRVECPQKFQTVRSMVNFIASVPQRKFDIWTIVDITTANLQYVPNSSNKNEITLKWENEMSTNSNTVINMLQYREEQNWNRFPFRVTCSFASYMIDSKVDWFDSLMRMHDFDIWHGLLYSHFNNKIPKLDNERVHPFIKPLLKDMRLNVIFDKWPEYAKIAHICVGHIEPFRGEPVPHVDLLMRCPDGNDVNKQILDWAIVEYPRMMFFGWLGVRRNHDGTHYAEMLLIDPHKMQDYEFDQRSSEQLLAEAMDVCLDVKFPGWFKSGHIFDRRNELREEYNDKIKRLNEILEDEGIKDALPYK